MTSLDITGLAAQAAAFRTRMQAAKRQHASSEFGWYPYDTLQVLQVLDSMLSQAHRDLLPMIGAAPILDIGCADGDLSFFFESIGCSVVAVDNWNPNYNRTLGFQTLHRALRSSVEFVATDIDRGLELGSRTFGLSLCLGVLYHLKNPFCFLEDLARQSRHCILSTRIAQETARGLPLAGEPVAYLLDRSEVNDDASNYWIFSESGLQRILDRTGWEICDYATTGREKDSNPSDQERDQRAFCLLRSRMPEPWAEIDLVKGWHAMEGGSWRWTERRFVVRLLNARPAASALQFRFRLNEKTLAGTGPVRLWASVGPHLLPAVQYSSAGEQEYRQALPMRALTGDSLEISFELDKAWGPTAEDTRELGVQVTFWSYESAVPKPACPILLE